MSRSSKTVDPCFVRTDMSDGLCEQVILLNRSQTTSVGALALVFLVSNMLYKNSTPPSLCLSFSQCFLAATPSHPKQLSTHPCLPTPMSSPSQRTSPPGRLIRHTLSLSPLQLLQSRSAPGGKASTEVFCSV
jgi:hypothetical protein